MQGSSGRHRIVSGGVRCLFESLEARLFLSAVKAHHSLKSMGSQASLRPLQTVADTTAPTVSLTSPATGSLLSRTSPAFAGIAGTASGDNATVTIRIYAGSSATGSPVQTLNTSKAASGAFSITADPLPQGRYTAQATQSDSSNNVGSSSASTFAVYSTIAGDANGDGAVNFADYVVVSNNYGMNVSGPSNGDFDFSNNVNFADFVILSNQYGKVATPLNALLPGAGFSEATPAPPINGSGAGSTTRAIARWDIVPYQTFSGTVDVGVVAFNSTGIDHVSFSVNGGPWTNVYEMTLNPQTGVVEYWCGLDGGVLANDGRLEIRAIAYPKVGSARVLQGPVANNGTRSLYLFDNARGTLAQPTVYVSTTGNDISGNGSLANPFASIIRAVQASGPGTTIYMQPGTYSFADLPSGFVLNDRWITITPAPGVARSSVIIRPNSRNPRVYHLALSNVTVDALNGYDLYTSPIGSFGGAWTDAEVWLDNCSISSSLGKDHLPELGALIDPFSWAAAYVTNSTIHDYPGRAIVADRVEIIRNVQISNIGDDAIDNPQLVVNTGIDLVVANNPEDHIDAIQYFPDHSDMNSIVYNTRATRVDGQLLFGGLLIPSQGGPPGGIFSNVAVVNFLGTSLEGPIANPSASQIGGGQSMPADNLLFYHLTLPNQSFFFTNDPGTSVFSNTVVEASVFWRLYEPTATGITINTSHIIDLAHEGSAIPVGSYTSGDPGFVSNPQPDGTYAPTGDFHLKPTSALKHRVTLLRVPIDLDGILRVAPGSIGAYE